MQRKTGSLNGKTAIITGAGAGFGAAIAHKFAAQGANIIIADINPIKAAETAEAIGKHAIAVQCDVARFDDMQQLQQQALSHFGQIDIFVANAGFSHRASPLNKVDEESFNLVNDINMKALFYAGQTIISQMMTQKSGVVLTLGATSAMRPRKGLTWFSASKGWVVSATRSMALELSDYNIRVNCVCPAESDTDMLKAFYGSVPDQKLNDLKKSIPLGRLAKPEDIANAALWLCSDHAEFITGAILPVDGGYGI